MCAADLYELPSHSSSLANFVLNLEKETHFIKNQIETLRTTGKVPDFDVGPIEPPVPKVSPGFGATPIRNWPNLFYFGGVTTPNPSVFFPTQQEQTPPPFDIAKVLQEYRKNKQKKRDEEKERKRLEQERKRKEIVQEPESSLMYTKVYFNPEFSLEQENAEEEITKIYDNPHSPMTKDLHEDSIPYISTYYQVSDSSKSVQKDST